MAYWSVTTFVCDRCENKEQVSGPFQLPTGWSQIDWVSAPKQVLCPRCTAELVIWMRREGAPITAAARLARVCQAAKMVIAGFVDDGFKAPEQRCSFATTYGRVRDLEDALTAAQPVPAPTGLDPLEKFWTNLRNSP
jgi:hypothetical protein